jgi:hypothetical protein
LESLGPERAPAPPGEVQGSLDLSKAMPNRRYLAVTDVEPAGHHFTIWYHDVEPSVVSVRVEQTASGGVELVPTAAYWGGLGIGPRKVRAIPDSVRALARQVEGRFMSACSGVGRVLVQYNGEYREVTLYEFIPASNGRVGWHASQRVAMDATLTQVVSGASDRWSGFGYVDVSAKSQWLSSSGAAATTLVTAEGVPPALVGELGEAARRYESGAATVQLESLVPEGSPRIPPELASEVVATVRLYPRGKSDAGPGGPELNAALPLRDAVFGTGASGEAQGTIGTTRYTVRATLTPSKAFLRAPGFRKDNYSGTLLLHVEDDAGGVWEHSYSATGGIEREGEGVVAPAGLVLSGAVAPSPDAEALRGKLPGRGRFSHVDVVVDIELIDDPRR